MRSRAFRAAAAAFLLAACAGSCLPARDGAAPGPYGDPLERHLRNVRRLTDSGENAEAYFSGDGKQLIYQSTHGDLRCDQIFVMNGDGTGKRMVSTGRGRTTCSYFFPDGSRIVYASTHAGGADCPPPPPRDKGYVWPLYAAFDIYSAKPDGSDLRRLTDTPGYDAEATISPDGRKIAFTSVRDGDLDVYVMNADGSDPRRLTRTLGYDGGAFFSPDGKTICFRASRPQGEQEERTYRELLAQNLVRPSELEIFVMDSEGGHVRQVTRNGGANFCPFFHPSGTKIIYASNKSDPKARSSDPFDLYMVNADGTGEERITFHRSFDAFPMFSPDGKRLVWASNRFNAKPGETNIFVADWVE
ncbi:MAG: PD40 domain-containing protein [Planctomycetes bacterium]|nr:PD40 domain-containing protein [Planctomycetota bacterium]